MRWTRHLVMFFTCAIAGMLQAVERPDPAELLARALAAEDRHTEQELLLQLMRLEPPPSDIVDRLIDSLPRVSSMNRSWVLGVVRRCGPRAAPAIPALIELLDGSDHHGAAHALAAIGGQAVPALVERLGQRDGTPRARRLAVQVLGQVIEDPEQLQAALQPASDDPDPQTAGLVAVLIDADRFPHDERIGTHLVGELHHWLDDQHGRAVARTVLSRPGALDDGNRQAVLYHLMDFTTAELLGILAQITALPAAPGMPLEMLLRLQGHADEGIAAAATAAAAAQDPARRERVDRLADQLAAAADDPSRLAVLEQTPAIELGPCEIIPQLEPLLAPAHSEPLQLTVVDLLGQCPIDLTAALLVGLLDRPTTVAGRAAAQIQRHAVLGQRGNRAKEGYLARLRSLRGQIHGAARQSDSTAVIDPCVGTLALFDDSESIQLLMDLASQQDHHHAAALALQNLARLGHLPALELARSQATHADAERAQSAREARDRLLSRHARQPAQVSEALDNPMLRLAALKKLQRRGSVPEQLLPRLRQLIADTSIEPQHLRWAIRALSQSGRPPAGIVPDLIPLIGHPDAEVRSAVARLLVDVDVRSAEGTAALVAQLAELSLDGSNATNLLGAITAVAPGAARHHDELIRWIGHSDALIHQHAVLALAADNQREAALPLIEETLRTGDQHERRPAIAALGILARHHDDLATRLVAMLRTDSDDTNRYQAIIALARSDRRTPEVLQALIAALDDWSSTVRIKAAWTLGDWNEAAAEALPALRQALADERLPPHLQPVIRRISKAVKKADRARTPPDSSPSPNEPDQRADGF